MTPRFDIVAGSRTKVSDLESGYHNVLAMKIINIYVAYNIRKLVTQITIYSAFLLLHLQMFSKVIPTHSQLIL